MIPIGRREPNDEKTPEQTIEHVIRSWENELRAGRPVRALSAEIIESLVYKAYFEQAEDALRWLNSTDESPDVMERIGLS